MSQIAAIDAVILCGGLGTRLQPVVPDRPKALAAIQGTPFLDILVDDLRRQGIRRFVFCVGHMKEQIIAHFSGRTDSDYFFSAEDSPLGTGGAVRNAQPLIRSDPFLVLNGDSFCRVDYAALLRFHQAKRSALTVVAAPIRNRDDGGTLQLDQEGRLVSFQEKSTAPAARFINAGVYLMPLDIVRGWLPDRPFSLERDVFPQLAATRRCFGFAVDSDVIDIGTPDRYQGAQSGLS